MKIGDKVIHTNHGKGIIVDSYGNASSFLVRFEKDIRGFGNELEVSTACLKLDKSSK
jgi:hypothetical protein